MSAQATDRPQPWALAYLQATGLVLVAALVVMLALGRGVLIGQEPMADGQLCTYATLHGPVTQRLRHAEDCSFVAIAAPFGAPPAMPLP